MQTTGITAGELGLDQLAMIGGYEGLVDFDPSTRVDMISTWRRP